MKAKKIHFFLRALFLAWLLTLGNSQAMPVQWEVGAGGNGHWYEAVLVRGGINWADANAAAIAAGGYLTTITSMAENNFVFSLVSNNDNFWYIDSFGNGIGPYLGGFQPPGSPEPAGGWQRVTGEPFNFTNWAPGEPNEAGDPLANDENRLQFFGSGTLKGPTWNDFPGEIRIRGYIREFNTLSSIPEPSILTLFAAGLVGFNLFLARRLL